jgi:ribose/xylose/arabinose/galactoside ABC-type transport system permease subunit
VACLAIGQTLVILTAGIDLSVGAITILAMMVMATLAAENGVSGGLAILIGIALCITIDLDHPRTGLIRLNDAPLIDLKLEP